LAQAILAQGFEVAPRSCYSPHYIALSSCVHT